MRHAPRPGPIQQLQRDLGLGLKDHRRRDSGPLATLRLLRPRAGQVQLHRHRPRGLGITVAAGHRHLAVPHLAQGARILASDPHRGRALLGKAGIVEDQDTIARGRFGDHLRYPLPVQILLVPLHIGEELLQPLGIGPWHRLSDGIAILIGHLSEQPCGLTLQGVSALRPPKTHLEGPQKFASFRQLGRTGMHLHRYPPFTIEDTTAPRILTE